MIRRARWLGLGLASLVLSALTYAVLVRTRPGQAADADLMTAILDTTPAPVGAASAVLARPLLFYVLGPLVVLLGLLALARGRWAAAFAAAVVSAAPALCSLPLREQILTRPDLGVRGYAYNTFPSTHAAAAFGLLAALLLVWPRPLDRQDVSRVSFLAAIVLVGNVTSYAHRPADVLGALLIACGIAWLAVGVVGFRPATPRRRRDRPRSSPT